MQTVKLTDWQIAAIEVALEKMQRAWVIEGKVAEHTMASLNELIALMSKTRDVTVATEKEG